MDVKFISKDEVKRLLKLNTEQMISLLATFNIKSESKITQNTLKGMVSYLNKINKTSIEIDFKNIQYTNTAKIEIENLEDLIKKRKKPKTHIKEPEDTKPTQQIQETKIKEIDDTKQIENPIVEEIKIPKINKIPKTEKQKKEKVSKKETKVKKKIIEDSSKQKIKNTLQPKKIKSDKKKIEPKNKIKKEPKKKISLVQQRYELYVKNCTKNHVEPILMEQYKTIKNYPIESNYIFHKSLRNTQVLANGLRKITNYKDASRIYNSGYIVYYVNKNADTSILCKLDITKPFLTNLTSSISSNNKLEFDFYTKCEKFDTNLIESLFKKTGKVWTEEEDEKILSFYNSSHYGISNKKAKSDDLTLKELANELKVYPQTIRNRAIQLGFTNFRKPREKIWSKEEHELLKKCAGKYNTKKISKIFTENGFTRGPIAIAIKLKRLDISQKLDGTGELNLTMLSKLMGVDSHFFYDNDRLKKLNARKENTQMLFAKKDISLYLKENPYDYSLARVEPKWFIEMLTNNDN